MIKFTLSISREKTRKGEKRERESQSEKEGIIETIQSFKDYGCLVALCIYVYFRVRFGSIVSRITSESGSNGI